MHNELLLQRNHLLPSYFLPQSASHLMCAVGINISGVEVQFSRTVCKVMWKLTAEHCYVRQAAQRAQPLLQWEIMTLDEYLLCS